MPASRRLLPTLAVLLTASALASEAQAGPRREIAPSTRTTRDPGAAPGAPAPTPPRATPPAPPERPAPHARKRAHPQSPAPTPDPSATRATPVPKDSPSAASKPVPKASPSVESAPVPKDSPAAKATPVPKDSPAAKATPVPRDSDPTARRAARRTREPTAVAAAEPSRARLRPRREPLLARHPAASCALDPLEAVALGQHGRARDSLREFYWSDMARFFESSLDLAEPVPTQVPDPAFVPVDGVLRDLPATVRAPLSAVAGARVIDRLGEREFTRVSKLLASLSPAQVAGLLRTDAPTLRGYVWTWLTTTKTGGCHLGHLDLDFIEAAVGDRSVAVEHGDDLVYRSLGDYALAARARLATLDPTRFDAFLTRLTTAGEIDPLVRATAHGMLLRRAHWDTLPNGLRDASPPVRAATAAAAIEMNHDKVEASLVEHAASDPADLVTELIVGALLGIYDPHSHGRPQLRGPLATTRDERLLAAVNRWRGRGDPLEPLPVPHSPLRLDPAPVSPDMSPEPAPPGRPALSAPPPAPIPTDSQPVPEDTPPSADPQPSADPAATRTDDHTHEPHLPGVLDD